MNRTRQSHLSALHGVAWMLLAHWPVSGADAPPAAGIPAAQEPPRLVRAEDIQWKKPSFTFTRLRFSTGVGRSRGGWSTDYPDADVNLSTRFHLVTSLPTDMKGRVLSLTDPALKECPFVYIAEGGGLALSDAEAANMRAYLLGGGFLMVDDFWGVPEWQNVAHQMKRVFPDREPIELPLNHPVFRCFYEIKEKPQVPNIALGIQSQFTGVTWERADAKEAHYRGIVDDNGRLMAIFCHNTDLGDGWERYKDHEYYAREFSFKRAFPMGINIIVYALTH